VSYIILITVNVEEVAPAMAVALLGIIFLEENYNH
jgi:hypothetical protein